MCVLLNCHKQFKLPFLGVLCPRDNDGLNYKIIITRLTDLFIYYLFLERSEQDIF